MSQLSLQVTVCTYNNAEALERTLKSITDQARSSELDWSVMVVDNNSADHTEDVVRRASSRSNGPVLYVREERQGLGYARRRAVIDADAEWLAFVDDDCVLAQDWLDRAAAVVNGANPELGVLGGRVRVVFPHGSSAVALRHLTSFAEQDHGDAPQRLEGEELLHLVGAGLIVRRAAVERSGWPESFRLPGRTGVRLGAGDDSELVIAICNAGYEAWYDPGLLLCHEIPPRRTGLDHLCRMHFGFGEAGPHLQSLLGLVQLDTTPSRLLFLLRQSAGAVWYLSSWMGAAALGAEFAPDRRIRLWGMLGRLRSALSIMKGGGAVLRRGGGAS
jgi:glucosyl-dolichyl phosphate glucuronosyltransferase